MKRSLAALLLAIALYTAVGAWDLRLPGLMSDEAADAVPALEMLAGQTPSAMQNITLFGREVPLMMLHHIGPASIYTSAAGFALFGPSVESLRLSQLAVGALALVLLWLLARLWGGDLAAAIAALLCASMPPFIWWSRAGANYTVPLLPPRPGDDAGPHPVVAPERRGLAGPGRPALRRGRDDQDPFRLDADPARGNPAARGAPGARARRAAGHAPGRPCGCPRRRAARPRPTHRPQPAGPPDPQLHPEQRRADPELWPRQPQRRGQSGRGPR
ncbi:MAG: glycosyltransferase family 39 protein [Anaerolineae bacterium]|nr:glycosyltransferase family 39 protein [Anaerolineae bacterium]